MYPSSIGFSSLLVLGHFEADGQGVHHLQAPAVGTFQPLLAVVADVHQSDAIFGDIQRPDSSNQKTTTKYQ